MDPEKLKRLRETFADAPGDQYFSAKFRRIGEQLAADPHPSRKPYSGVPTLLDLPYREAHADLDVALVGVPMDLGVTNRSGARHGPRAVRAIERVGPHHHVHDIVPQARLRCADVGDVPLGSRFSLTRCREDIEVFYRQLKADSVIPISVGGDHSITHPIMRGLHSGTPLGMLHIDAHCDTGGAYDGEKFHHGGPFRNAVLDGVLDPERCIQIGIRGAAEVSTEFSHAAGMTVIHIEKFHTLGVERVVERVREVVGGGPIYVTIDVDGIDPAYTPGTGTPEVGGLTPLEVQRVVRGLAGLPIAGGDVVEIAPQYDPTSNTAHVGATMLFEILALVALGRPR